MKIADIEIGSEYVIRTSYRTYNMRAVGLAPGGKVEFEELGTWWNGNAPRRTFQARQVRCTLAQRKVELAEIARRRDENAKVEAAVDARIAAMTNHDLRVLIDKLVREAHDNAESTEHGRTILLRVADAVELCPTKSPPSPIRFSSSLTTIM